MYEFVDRPVTALDRGGHFLIWAMRRWVECLGNGGCPCGSVGPAFAKWHMMAGFPHFHMMMALLNRDAREKFRFGPGGHEHVTEHEALIIGMIRAVRAEPTARMREAAGHLVHENAVAPLLIAMSALGEALVEADLWPMPPNFNPDCASFRHE